MTVLTLRRPSALLVGRTLPSLPILPSTRAMDSVDRCLIPATVVGARPVAVAINRSDQFGCDTTIRAAASVRSASERGNPRVTFAWTASTKASISPPS
ncbi:hypothetical protein SAMN05421810_1128 [Amycolatopsis arida]|uniref:Uncharacterized protein n=1 Tax=Amycolatopsis arida TaxID=587909 RepID=A0A1I6ACF1_9PSEU|nr:hypothetical protein CLV69_102734 [Amycolatopsis arida]SFQ66424.1 hypothetical protein SAMN05421810_1128 [Amycolatopsis arida]